MHFRFHFNFSCSITFLQFYWLCSLTKLTDCCRCKISLDENGRWHAAQRHITTNGSNIQQRFISFMKIFYLIHKMKNITIHLRSPIINMHLTLQQTGSDFITDKEAPSSNTSIPNKRDAGDFMLSASLWEVLINSPIEEKSHVGFAKKRGINWTCSQYLRNKRLLQQRKQLLLHPMKEAEETQGRKGERHKYTDDISEPEDTEEIIHKQICSLGKPSGDFMNITHLMNFDLSSTLEEWSNFQQLKRKIGTEIGDAIMGEIVEEIIELFFR